MENKDYSNKKVFKNYEVLEKNGLDYLSFTSAEIGEILRLFLNKKQLSLHIPPMVRELKGDASKLIINFLKFDKYNFIYREMEEIEKIIEEVKAEKKDEEIKRIEERIEREKKRLEELKK